MSAHTHGPLHINTKIGFGVGAGDTAVMTADNDIVAECFSCIRSADEFAFNEAAANAHLFAAAHQLLSAAEQFRAACKDGNADTLLDYFDDIFGVAIKAAKGDPT